MSLNAFGASTFSRDSWWHFKDTHFQQGTSLQLEYTLRMYALSRFWLRCNNFRQYLLPIVEVLKTLLRQFFNPSECCGNLKVLGRF